MKKKGVDVKDVRTRIVDETAECRSGEVEDAEEEQVAPPPNRLSGINDDQATAIRAAVRAHKARRRRMD